MGSPPPVVPHIYLPGMEFQVPVSFQKPILQPRQSFFALGTVNPLGPGLSAQQEVFFNLDTQWHAQRGIYIHRAWVQFDPQDTSGEVQVTGATLSLNRNSALTLGAPYLVFATPTIVETVLFAEDLFFTFEDVAQLNAQGGAPFPVSPLFIDGIVLLHNNDPTNPHNVRANIGCTWRLIDGVGS